MNMFFKKPTTTASLIESIKAQMETERARIADLVARHGVAALDAVTGDDKLLKEVSSELVKANNHLGNLNSALIEAEKREQAEIAAKLETEWQGRVENYKKALDRHAARADRMRQVIGEFAKAYKNMVESGAECLRANPTAVTPPYGVTFDRHAINQAVALELARYENPKLGDTPTSRMPGSARATIHYNPNDIKPLIEDVLDSNAYALKAAKKGRLK